MPDVSKGRLKPSSKPNSSDLESRKFLNIDTQSTRIENGTPIEMQPMLSRKSDSHHTTTILNANSDKSASKNTEINYSAPTGTPLIPESVESDKLSGVILLLEFFFYLLCRYTVALQLFREKENKTKQKTDLDSDRIFCLFLFYDRYV